MKVLERMLERRLRELVTINAMQVGFMPGIGTASWQLREKFLKKNKKIILFGKGCGFGKGFRSNTNGGGEVGTGEDEIDECLV